MKVVVSSKIKKTEALFIFLSKSDWKKELKGLDNKWGKLIEGFFKDKSFQGKKGEVWPIESLEKEAKKTFLVGIGEKGKSGLVRAAAGVAIRKSIEIEAASVSFYLGKDQSLSKTISGSILGGYVFKVTQKKAGFKVKNLQIITSEKLSTAELNSEIALAEATNTTRDLINLPSNMMTPKILSERAKALGKGLKSTVKVKILGEKEMTKLGMDSLLGVGQGSKEESQLIVFEYNGGKKGEAPLALVGKGVCFDSGGYNLKPTGHIEEMKSDMGGAATVLGMFEWIKETKPKKNIIGVIGAVENLINGEAFKPGDIISSMKGDTIEITNTDAEGRLVLADCLYYTATKYKPAKIVDLATLTGACIAALGYEITAIMGNDPKTLKAISKASEGAEEMVWELPITDLFREKIKGSISDLVNWTAGVNAGSSMGGAFLENFVEETPWVHIDIAGTAFQGKYESPTAKKGATGVMLRTLKNWIESEV